MKCISDSVYHRTWTVLFKASSEWFPSKQIVCAEKLWLFENFSFWMKNIDKWHMRGGNKVFSKAKPLNVCVSQRWFCRRSAVQYCMLGSFWSLDLAVFVGPMLWCRWLVKLDQWIIKRHVRSVISEGHIQSSAEKLMMHISLFRCIIRRIDEY